ncbi:MAG: hypothetical protein ACI87H_002847 [Gammaproteobacteria bacterium]|jgi:hypothetical protein
MAGIWDNAIAIAIEATTTAQKDQSIYSDVTAFYIYYSP